MDNGISTMKTFKNFRPYEPGHAGVAGIDSALYLCDEDGNDWYEAQAQFSPGTLKVCYDEDGRVRAFATGDANGLFPVGLSVTELKATRDNLSVTLEGDWFYRNGRLQRIVDHVAVASAERDRLMREVAGRIDWLAAAACDGDITKKEAAELTALRAYRSALRRLDVSTAPDITWPEAPEHVG